MRRTACTRPTRCGFFSIFFSGSSPTQFPRSATPRAVRRPNALARVKRGSDFGSLASQVSEDPGSKADRGFLPPSPKGKFVPAFDSAGWTLAPGAVSGVVETPFGYHIIKRPGPEAARERITTYLAQSAGTRLDSIYMDSLAQTKQIKVARGAAKAMRDAGEDPEAARKSKKTLVSFKGGELTVAEFMRWVQALPPQYIAQLKQADDSMLTQFAKILTQNVLLLRQADSAKYSCDGGGVAGLGGAIPVTARHPSGRDGPRRCEPRLQRGGIRPAQSCGAEG